MKRKSKGKIHPSPSVFSAASSSSSHRDGDVLSVLNLLPAAIIALAAVLSLEDREVLAYMVTRSLKTPTGTATSTSSSDSLSKKKVSSKSSAAAGGAGEGGSFTHKAPLFHCDCFHCYTGYWFRWDSSPNRELIHQAIEAFEEHLASSEQLKKNVRGKRREKAGHSQGQSRTRTTIPQDQPDLGSVRERRLTGDGSTLSTAENNVNAGREEELEHSMEADIAEEIAPQKELPAAGVEDEDVSEMVIVEGVDVPATASSMGNDHNHKGLARKVLPDVMGLLNSRLWKLWNPSV